MAAILLVQQLTDDALWARVARQARCADSGLDPDQWYPVSTAPAQARRGRRRTALSGTIVQPLLPSLPLGLVPGGDAR